MALLAREVLCLGRLHECTRSDQNPWHITGDGRKRPGCLGRERLVGRDFQRELRGGVEFGSTMYHLPLRSGTASPPSPNPPLAQMTSSKGGLDPSSTGGNRQVLRGALLRRETCRNGCSSVPFLLSIPSVCEQNTAGA